MNYARLLEKRVNMQGDYVIMIEYIIYSYLFQNIDVPLTYVDMRLINGKVWDDDVDIVLELYSFLVHFFFLKKNQIVRFEEMKTKMCNKDTICYVQIIFTNSI